MSMLPGLGLTEPEEAAKVETTQHALVKESEWRFEVAADKYIQVKVSVNGQTQTHEEMLRF